MIRSVRSSRALSVFSFSAGALASVGLLACCGAAADDTGAAGMQNADYTSTTNATIAFAQNGAPTVTGTLQAATTIRIDYVANRLLNGHPECNSNTPHVGYLGFVQMGIRMNGDVNRTSWQGLGSGGEHPNDAQGRHLLALPADVTKLELWFMCGTNAYQDQAFDSKNGQNYVFNIAAPAAIANGRIVGTSVTPIANAVDVSYSVGNQVSQGMQYSRPYTVTVAFDDINSFAGDYYPAIHAVVGLETHKVMHGSLDHPTSLDFQTIELTRDGQRFVGSLVVSLGGYVGDSDTVLDAVQVAVSDDQGHWESNDGKNYRFAL